MWSSSIQGLVGDRVVFNCINEEFMIMIGREGILIWFFKIRCRIKIVYLMNVSVVKFLRLHSVEK
jgi:hypothetical protein